MFLNLLHAAFLLSDGRRGPRRNADPIYFSFSVRPVAIWKFLSTLAPAFAFNQLAIYSLFCSVVVASFVFHLISVLVERNRKTLDVVASFFHGDRIFLYKTTKNLRWDSQISCYVAGVLLLGQSIIYSNCFQLEEGVTRVTFRCPNF